MVDETDDNLVSHNLIKAFLSFRRMGMNNGRAFELQGTKSPSGLRHSEVMILFAIKEIEDDYPDGISVSDLSNYLNVKPPTITPMLSSLEEKKMLKRIMDTDDRRVMRIFLEEAGNSLVEKSTLHFVDHLKGLVDYLGEEKSNTLAELMNEMYEYFSKAQKNEKGKCPNQP